MVVRVPLVLGSAGLIQQLQSGDTLSTGGGGGTVTNIGTGTGLIGGPINTSGTISLVTPVAPGNLGTGATGSNFLRSDGTWQTPPGGTGTITSITAGTGLSASLTGGRDSGCGYR